ncbi:H-2 class II histocompatibility antigen, E-S beta chain-like isoform X2 [Scyliorhinus canicula]|uniref:H-2 class II histocompatibility antigen, E-S beta chain-like isoform X2 n=1 Tax=Scyliorhinus canicula TaxID=7830 RepID=UPI0018F6C3F6|nr:H-2 class II histocompatibility antigen, E-S beta chain-like isoform X2 [Scyliorhinus canicula]
MENSPKDLHLFHVQCECIFNGNKATNFSWQDGYDGITILYYDFTNTKFVAVQSIAQAEVDRRNSDTFYIASVPRRIEGLCNKIKQTAITSSFSVEKMAPIPSKVFLQKKSGQTYLVCLVKNFFPRDIKMSWLRNGVVIANGPQTVNIAPQDDKTFQARSLLTLNEDVSGSYICQVEHEALTRKLQVPFRYDRTTKNEALIIIGAVLGILGISFAVLTGILYYCNLNRSDQFNVNPTAKFTKRAGPCGRNPCSSSVRSSSSETSNTSNTSCSSADDLTKSHA